jgi:para-nitrobenzyl esterase
MVTGMSTDRTVVATKPGRVRGEDLGDVLVWRGIPYAEPPTGKLRFRAPQPAVGWGGVRAATAFGPVAWQTVGRDPFTGQLIQRDRSEDCLYLNVTAPVAPSVEAAGYPVLVWVHGGGYVQGAGPDNAVGDGAGMARRGLVVVTFNYRLGALGFLDVPGLDEADSGSAGFLDQVAALSWVRDHISGFGGDPARVTVYGTSAGAKSVANLLASPLTRGTISRAISSSGGGDYVATPEQAARLRQRFCAELGRPGADASQLRAIPAADLLAAQEAIGFGVTGIWIWRPVLGATGIGALPAEALARGAAAGIPLLIGNNGNEGAPYQLMDPAADAAGQAPRVLADGFGTAQAQAMLDAYAAARPELSPAGIGLAVLGDERYGIPTLRAALAQAAHGPVWRYRYDTAPPGVPQLLAGGHGLDVNAIWAADSYRNRARAGDARAGNAQAGDARAGDARAVLALAMARAWAAFAAGRPPAADPDLPSWPRFEPGRQLTMILDAEPHVEPHPRAAQAAIWAGRTWPPGAWWEPGGAR